LFFWVPSFVPQVFTIRRPLVQFRGFETDNFLSIWQMVVWTLSVMWRKQIRPWGNSGAKLKFLESTPIQMLSPGGSIRGKLTQDLPLGCLQGGGGRGGRRGNRCGRPSCLSYLDPPRPVRGQVQRLRLRGSAGEWEHLMFPLTGRCSLFRKTNFIWCNTFID